MSQYLIKFSRKRAWDIIPYEWLESGEVQCDPITDLRTRDGKLSIWEIDDKLSNLDLVLSALACTRERFDEVDYGMFDPSIVEDLGINVELSQGNTPVPKANKYHRDLAKLTVSGLAQLVNNIFSNIEKDRRLEAEIRKLILEVWDQDVDHKRIHKKLGELVEQELRLN